MKSSVQIPSLRSSFDMILRDMIMANNILLRLLAGGKLCDRWTDTQACSFSFLLLFSTVSVPRRVVYVVGELPVGLYCIAAILCAYLNTGVVIE
jgi:hypothetical protein